MLTRLPCNLLTHYHLAAGSLTNRPSELACRSFTDYQNTQRTNLFLNVSPWIADHKQDDKREKHNGVQVANNDQDSASHVSQITQN